MLQETNNGQNSVIERDKDTPLVSISKGSYSDITLDNYRSYMITLGGGKFSYGFYMLKWKATSEKITITLEGISWQVIFKVLTLLGYRKFYTGNSYQFVLVVDNIMTPVTCDMIKSHVFRLAEDERDIIEVEFKGGFASFTKDTLLEVLRRNGNSIFNRSYFEQLRLQEVPLLRDTRDMAYFPFANGVLKVTATRTQFVPYSLLDNVTIWKSHIIDKPFTWINPTPENSPFMEVVKNLASGEEARLRSLCSAIGYILHNYNHTSKAMAVVLYDEKPTKKGSANGGTGKGLIFQAIGKVRRLAIIDGKRYNPEDRFAHQIIDQMTQVMGVDDLRQGFRFEYLYSLITEGITIEKKNEQAIKIPAKESPKIIISSNNIVGGTGTSDIRRQFIVELSDYYSSRIKPGGISPVEREHGILFDDDIWNTDQWNAFYSFMLQCVQLYLAEALIPYQYKNIARNRILQGCGEDFTAWIFQQGLTVNREYNATEMYSDYTATYYAGNIIKFPFKTFGNHIKTFGEAHGWTVERRRGNHINYFTYRSATWDGNSATSGAQVGDFDELESGENRTFQNQVAEVAGLKLPF